MGQVSQPGGTPVSWTLSVAPADGSADPTVIASGSGAVNGTLGTFDPTTLANGEYVLTLTATNTGGLSEYTQTDVSVNGTLKIGDFGLSFTDLSVPVAGLPATVTRSYDSLNANTSGDFGYGWSMAYDAVQLQATDVSDDGEHNGDGYYAGFLVGTKVWVTLPGGDREQFTFEPQLYDDNPFGPQYYTPAFQAGPGVTDTLTVDSDYYLTTPDNGPAGIGSEMIDSGTDEYYNPANPDFGGHYTLTTSDGLKYDIEFTGEDTSVGQLYSITDRVGNTLTRSDSGITTTDPTGKTLAQITFTRDSAGRITTITDPNGEQLSYGYDAAGDLVSFTDADNRTTRYEYNDADRPHFLTDIIDADGNTVAHADFDPTTGRLKDLTNAAGDPVTFGYDLNDQPGQYAETTVDPLGYATTTVADANGNVTRTVKQIDDPNDPTQADYQVVVSQYNDPNNPYSLTAQSESFTTDYADRLTAQPTAWAQQNTYDNLGDVLTSTDGNGQTTASTYNGYGQLLTQTDPLQNTTTYAYNSDGTLQSVAAPGLPATTYHYDADGNLTQSYDPDGALTSSAAYAGGLLMSQTDASGKTTTFTYDAAGNQTGTSYLWTDPADPNHTQAVGASTTYYPGGQVDDSTDAYGQTMHTDYTTVGKVADTIDPQGDKTSYVYDALGNVIQTVTTDGTGAVTSVTDTVYDADNRAVWSDDPHLPGQATQGTHTVYDGLGDVVETDRVADVVITVDASGGTPTAALTSSGSVLSTSTTTYNPDGTVLSTTDAAGLTTSYTYDGDGRVLTSTQHDVPVWDPATGQTVAENLTTTTTYDADGRQHTVTDPLGHVTTTDYNADGQVSKTTFDDGTSVQYGYDNEGNKTSETDQLNHTTSYRYNAAGELTEVDQSDGPVTRYTYDAYGDELTQQDANNHTTTWTYDAFGNERSRTLPDGETEWYTYDADGRVQTHTDFDSNVTTDTYAPAGGANAGQLEQVTYAAAAGSGKASQTVSYTYDAQGRQQSVADASGTTTDGYDGQGNLVEEQTPEGTIWHVYDPATGLETEAYTDYTETFYGYDALGRLTSVTVKTRPAPTGTWSAPAVTTYGYDGAGNKAMETLPNGQVTTFTYDDLNRLTEQKTVNASGATVFDEHFTLDAVGNRTAAHQVQPQADGSTITSAYTWAYDSEGRLTGESLTATGSTSASNAVAANEDYSDTYQYDGAGNRTSDTHTGPGDGASGTTTYTYNGDDELTQSNSSVSGTTTYTYDPNGSQLTSTNGSTVTTYRYDVRNKMVSATVGGQTAKYVYDDAGDRVQETTGGVTTYYLTDNANPTGYAQPLEQRVGSPTAVPTVTYLIGDRVYGQVTSAGTSYFLTDGHGSTVALVGTTGAVAYTYAYTAYGDALTPLAATGATLPATVYLFGGDAVYDAASGLYLHGDGTRGRAGFRFVEADDEGNGTQINPISLHRYLYAGGSPVVYADPTGHEFGIGELSITVGLGAAVVGGIAWFAGVHYHNSALVGFGQATVIGGLSFVSFGAGVFAGQTVLGLITALVLYGGDIYYNIAGSQLTSAATNGNTANAIGTFLSNFEAPYNARGATMVPARGLIVVSGASGVGQFPDNGESHFGRPDVQTKPGDYVYYYYIDPSAQTLRFVAYEVGKNQLWTAAGAFDGVVTNVAGLKLYIDQGRGRPLAIHLTK